MKTATVTQDNVPGLPAALRTAQEAIHLPEVQEMLRKLSEHGLGIFMPHMHDEKTGDFRSLPEQISQVESGLQVNFQATAEVADQTERFLPVGWLWCAGTPTTVAVCEMIQTNSPGEKERSVKHKMPTRN